MKEQIVEFTLNSSDVYDTSRILRINKNTVLQNELVHDNVIGMYIERYYFKTELFRNVA